MYRLIVFLLLFAGSAAAQVATFQWSDEACSFEGTYDRRRYSPQQLRNIRRLLSPGEFDIEYSATVFQYEDIAKLDVATLDREYRRKTAALRSLDVGRDRYWLNVKQARMDEMRRVYDLSRVTIEGYRRPQALFQYSNAGSCRRDFAEPLAAGGQSLLDAWLKVNEASRRVNADPERLRREFEIQLASPDRMRFALVEVMTFGWWNCANALIDRADGVQLAGRERMFRKVFRRVRTRACETP
jgi:hypothetical protein